MMNNNNERIVLKAIAYGITVCAAIILHNIVICIYQSLKL